MLTREQIDWFDAIATTLPRSCDDTLPAFMLSLGLVNVGIGDRWVLTSAGHDLLATIQHLPEPEPEPAPPSCSRCGGETEVPVFMGPLMMPCPSCSNEDGSPKCVPALPTDHPTGDADAHPVAPGWDGWVHVHSEATAKPFAGQRVEVWAVSSRTWSDPSANGRVFHLTDCTASGIRLRGSDDLTVAWSDGGSVYLRLADMDHAWMLAAAGWVHVYDEHTARPFIGRRAEIHAPAVGEVIAHALHGEEVTIRRVVGGTVYFDSGCFIFCQQRGNVHFRPVAG